MVTKRRTSIKLTGTSFHQEALEALGNGKFTGILVPEPENLHDSEAVSVRVRGKHVGYLPKGWRQTKTRYVVQRMFSEHEGVVTVHVVGGWQGRDGRKALTGVRIE